MTLGQVAEAVLLGREQQSTDPEDQFRDVHDLLELCSSFVCLEGAPHPASAMSSFLRRIDREQIPSDEHLVLRLAHSSVKEYMLSDRTTTTSLSMHRVTSGIAQRLMAEVCLIYLNQFNNESANSDEILQRHQFLSYAAPYWYFHYEDMPVEEEEHNVVNLLLSFIYTHYNGYAYGKWADILPFWYLFRHRQPLADLSFLGASRAVRTIMKNAAEVHVTENMIGQSLNRAGILDASSLSEALSEATSAGHNELTELLIHKGAIAKSIYYHSVSEVAASQGKVHMVKLYLEWTADNVNKTEVFYGALQAAIIARQSSIIRYLLEDSDFEAREDLYSASLQMAYLERDDSAVQFLVGALRSEATAIRKIKIKVLDTSWTPRTKLVILQILGADIDHTLLERNHERDYIPFEDAYWENVMEVEDTITEILLEEKRLLEEEELTEETNDQPQRIRSLSTVPSPAVETLSDGMI